MQLASVEEGVLGGQALVEGALSLLHDASANIETLLSLLQSLKDERRFTYARRLLARARVHPEFGSLPEARRNCDLRLPRSCPLARLGCGSMMTGCRFEGAVSADGCSGLQSLVL